MIKQVRTIEEEISHFCVEQNNYYAVSSSGFILNIIQVSSIQLEIKDVNDYDTHLWVEAKEGFFLLRQNIKEKVAGAWILEKEIVPTDKTDFFNIFKEKFTENGYKIFENLTLL